MILGRKEGIDRGHALSQQAFIALPAIAFQSPVVVDANPIISDRRIQQLPIS